MFFEIFNTIILFALFLIVSRFLINIEDILLRMRFLLSDIAKAVDSMREFRKTEAEEKEIREFLDFLEKTINPEIQSAEMGSIKNVEKKRKNNKKK